jgi:formylglycine-generating enzyme required for sulfatase activity
MMGSGEDLDNTPVHEVTIARPFAVSKFPITFDEWDACASNGGECLHITDRWGRGRQPVIRNTRASA